MGNRAEAEFEANVESVAAARAFVAAVMTSWDLDDAAEVAVLLTSEIVTNAVLHARTAYRLTMEYMDPELVVEVTDSSDTLPRPVEPDPQAEKGRGLWLVDQLASRWGTALEETGKTLWFVIVCSRVTPPAVAGYATT